MDRGSGLNWNAVGAIVGIAALVVSMILLFRTLDQDERDLDLRVTPVIQRPGPELVELTVINRGPRPAELTDIGFEQQSRTLYTPPAYGALDLPQPLDDGETMSVRFRLSVIDRPQDRAVRAFAEESEGRRFQAPLDYARRRLARANE